MIVKKTFTTVFLLVLLCLGSCRSIGAHDEGSIFVVSSFEYTQEIDEDIMWEDPMESDAAMRDYDMMCDRSPVLELPWWKSVVLQLYGIWEYQYEFFNRVVSQGYGHIKKIRAKIIAFLVGHRIVVKKRNSAH